MNINIKNIYVINILNRLLYQPSSYEFISEIIYHTKFHFENEEQHRTSIVSLLSFSIANNIIVVEKVENNKERKIKKIYESNVLEDFILILNNNWNKFNDSNNKDIWYSFQINYTEEWKIELKKLNLWTE
jgi:hypothetical protein